jgi:hypothetical protein
VRKDGTRTAPGTPRASQHPSGEDVFDGWEFELAPMEVKAAFKPMDEGSVAILKPHIVTTFISTHRKISEQEWLVAG